MTLRISSIDPSRPRTFTDVRRGRRLIHGPQSQTRIDLNKRYINTSALDRAAFGTTGTGAEQFLRNVVMRNQRPVAVDGLGSAPDFHARVLLKRVNNEQLRRRYGNNFAPPGMDGIDRSLSGMTNSELSALGFSLKKAIKKVGKVAGKITKVVTKPVEKLAKVTGVKSVVKAVVKNPIVRTAIRYGAPVAGALLAPVTAGGSLLATSAIMGAGAAVGQGAGRLILASPGGITRKEALKSARSALKVGTVTGAAVGAAGAAGYGPAAQTVTAVGTPINVGDALTNAAPFMGAGGGAPSFDSTGMSTPEASPMPGWIVPAAIAGGIALLLNI